MLVIFINKIMKKHNTNSNLQQKKAKLSFIENINRISRLAVKKNSLESKNISSSSAKWLQRHINDPFVKASQIDGYLSRAAYKILEIDKKYHIFQNANHILDIGCSPGSWSQAVLRLKEKNKTQPSIIGVDLLDCKFKHNNFHFIQGNFEDENVLLQIQSACNNAKFDVIMSDIAPSASGDPETDRLLHKRIVFSMADFIYKNIAKNGSFICKMIHGSDDAEILKLLKTIFSSINSFKPSASRKESSEIYIICNKIKANYKNNEA
jgi:23S rRNA (uridine2552-2'-O)-methyltransferase